MIGSFSLLLEIIFSEPLEIQEIEVLNTTKTTDLLVEIQL